jgi:solute carrier family 35 (GDP-fucose transporter), member C1
MQRPYSHGSAERRRPKVCLAQFNYICLLSLFKHHYSFSNYTLKYVDASFYQVARGLVLPFTVLTSALLLASRPSLNILVSCSVVTAGFFIGVFLDGTPVSLVGIVFGVLSSATTALHAVVIKKSLDVVGGNALHLSWYTNLLSIGLLAPLVVLAGEVGEVWKLFGGEAEYVVVDGGASALRTFMWGSVITVCYHMIHWLGLFVGCSSDDKGSLGFLMSIASLLSIKVTSPITHMVSSAVRGVAASLLGMWLFHDIITLYVPSIFSPVNN